MSIEKNSGIPQVRAMVEMLPKIDVVAEDAFNSSPTDPSLMGPDSLKRFRDGQQLRATQIPTPLVRYGGYKVVIPYSTQRPAKQLNHTRRGC